MARGLRDYQFYLPRWLFKSLRFAQVDAPGMKMSGHNLHPTRVDITMALSHRGQAARYTDPAFPATLLQNIASLRPLQLPIRTRSFGKHPSHSSHDSSDPGTPNSQQSASMDESSDSDASPDSPSQGGEETPWPVDGLFVSHAEKAEIMGLREFEREVLLADRREKNERLRQNRMLRQLVINQDNEQTKRKNKRKAGAADLDEASQKTTRVRTKGNQASPRFETLRKAREDRSNRAQQREAERDRRKGRSPSYEPAADRDADDESDIEWATSGKRRSASRTPDVREIPPAELRDVERVRVGRSRFGEVCFYPGFDAAITGCYVRISIGPDPATREPVYRLAVIKGMSAQQRIAVVDSRSDCLSRLHAR
jgi:RNA polymerase-associated protein RTF1